MILRWSGESRPMSRLDRAARRGGGRSRSVNLSKLLGTAAPPAVVAAVFLSLLLSSAVAVGVVGGGVGNCDWLRFLLDDGSILRFLDSGRR